MHGKRTRFGRQKDSFFLSVERFEELALHIVEGGLKVKQHGLKATNVGGGVSKVEKIRIGLLVGGYSIPAIPTQSTENEGRVGRAGMPYPPTFVAFNHYN